MEYGRKVRRWGNKVSVSCISALLHRHMCAFMCIQIVYNRRKILFVLEILHHYQIAPSLLKNRITKFIKLLSYVFKTV